MKVIYTLVFFLFSNLLVAQDSLFSYIKADVTNHESVLLRWAVESGSSCNGIEVQRSTDSVNFITIHFISGICGNSSSPVPYQFEDESPVSNAINYYRLKPGNGTPTRFVSVFYVEYSDDGYYLFPNPAADQTTIYFNNSNSEISTARLMNSTGQLVYTVSTNSDFLVLNLSLLSSGIYFFSIEINQRLIQGRFVKN